MMTATTEIRHAWSANPSGVRRQGDRTMSAYGTKQISQRYTEAKEANVRGPAVVPVPFLFGRTQFKLLLWLASNFQAS